MEQPGRFSIRGLLAPLMTHCKPSLTDAMAKLRTRDRERLEAVDAMKRDELRAALELVSTAVRRSS